MIKEITFEMMETAGKYFTAMIFMVLLIEHRFGV